MYRAHRKPLAVGTDAAVPMGRAFAKMAGEVSTVTSVPLDYFHDNQIAALSLRQMGEQIGAQ